MRLLTALGKLLAVAAAAASAASIAAPAKDATDDILAIVAVEHAGIGEGASITGTIVVTGGQGPASLAAVANLGMESVVTGGIQADRVVVLRNARVTGTIRYRSGIVTAPGARIGAIVRRPQSTTPPIHGLESVEISADAPGVTVNSGETIRLPADATPRRRGNHMEYGDVTIAPGGRLIFGRGSYGVRSIRMAGGGSNDCGTPRPEIPDAACRAIVLGAGTDLRILDRLALGARAFIGMLPGEDDGKRGATLHIGGQDGGNGREAPRGDIIHIGPESFVRAALLAADGGIRLDADGRVEGMLAGYRVSVGDRAVVVARRQDPAPGGGTMATVAPGDGDDGDESEASSTIVAHPRVVFTNGASSVTIPLTGGDPEGGDLTFSIVTVPDGGAISLDQSPPGLPGKPAGCEATRTCLVAPRKDTRATATYWPDDPAAGADGFEFEVRNPKGDRARARVSIRLRRRDGNDYLAGEIAVETSAGVPVSIRLPETTTGLPAVGSRCETVACEPPENGALGELAHLADSDDVYGDLFPTVAYTPFPGFVGQDRFQFEGCEKDGETPRCAAGTVTVTVTRLAQDQVVEIVNPNLTGRPTAPLEIDIVLRTAPRYRGRATFAIANPPGHGEVIPVVPAAPGDETEGQGGEDGDKGNDERRQTYTYVADDPAFTGTDSFEFSVINPDGFGDIGVVTIAVQAPDCTLKRRRCQGGR